MIVRWSGEVQVRLKSPKILSLTLVNVKPITLRVSDFIEVGHRFGSRRAAQKFDEGQYLADADVESKKCCWCWTN